jgi:hypothetical protein
MNRLRRRLAWIASVWLCCQLSVLTAAPWSLLSTAAAAETPSCTCVHGTNAQCPMHHPASHFHCRSTTDPGAATLVSLLSPTAVLASAPSHAAPSPIGTPPFSAAARFTSVFTPPDGPPPRA